MEGRHLIVPDAEYIRRELPVRDVAERLGLEPTGPRLRCPLDRSHWASLWLRKNMVKCFQCRCRPWTGIDLVMEILQLDVRGAIDWVAAQFDVPRRRRRITTNRWGATRHCFVDYPANPRARRLIPSLAAMRRTPGWPRLSHAARLLAAVLLDIIPRDTWVITTTQEELRLLTGIADRRAAKNAIRQLVEIGLVATAREGADRDARSGQFTTVLCARLTWGSPRFQRWLSGAHATLSKCGELHTAKSTNQHEITHGVGDADSVHLQGNGHIAPPCIPALFAGIHEIDPQNANSITCGVPELWPLAEQWQRWARFHLGFSGG